jgi:tetrahydromethanopterin S-methyltransferase subunit A
MTHGTTLDSQEAARQMREAAAAKKCWRCGCFRSALEAIDRELPKAARSPELNAAIIEGRQRLVPIQYDCLGCEVCYPAIATNVLGLEGECAAPPVEERTGWPPLPGAYRVLRYQAPVAICTLTSEPLVSAIAAKADLAVAMVGTLFTENLGIERVITNVLANPRIRFLVLCGPDSKQAIGHLPGQSLLALAANGLDEHGRIAGARGKRPIIRNISCDMVDHFRRTVEVVDLTNQESLVPILDAVRECAQHDPGETHPFAADRIVRHETGRIPERMTSDPAGYFVVYVDRGARTLSIEHYANNGVLDVVIDGSTAPEIYVRAIELNLVSRFDHAAYLGRELARAERALLSGEPYVQDAAPERRAATPSHACGCSPKCSGE